MTDNFLELFGSDWEKPNAMVPDEIPIFGLDDPMIQHLEKTTSAADAELELMSRADLFQEMTGMSEEQSVEFTKAVPPPVATVSTQRTVPVVRTGGNPYLKLMAERNEARKEGRLAEWRKLNEPAI